MQGRQSLSCKDDLTQRILMVTCTFQHHMTLQVFVTQPSICMRLSLCSHQYGIRRVGHFSHNFLLPRNGNLVPKSAFCHFSRATKKSGYLQKSQDRWVHNKNASDRLTTKHWISNHLSYDHFFFFVID